jgi:hypothetical protein
LIIIAQHFVIVTPPFAIDAGIVHPFDSLFRHTKKKGGGGGGIKIKEGHAEGVKRSRWALLIDKIKSEKKRRSTL